MRAASAAAREMRPNRNRKARFYAAPRRATRRTRASWNDRSGLQLGELHDFRSRLEHVFQRIRPDQRKSHAVTCRIHPVAQAGISRGNNERICAVGVRLRIVAVDRYGTMRIVE